MTHALQTPSFAARLEHTLLRPDAAADAVDALCAEARAHSFYGVCVNGVHVARCAAALAASNVAVVTVVGFPLGACTTASKVFQTREAISLGADEIDMVLHLGALKAGAQDAVRADIEAVVEAASSHVVKVILETSALDEAEKRIACQLALQAGAHFVKTSTGFGARGASVDDVRLMRGVLGSRMGIKASGGIRTRAFADALVAAGADRLGVSASIALVQASSDSTGG